MLRRRMGRPLLAPSVEPVSGEYATRPELLLRLQLGHRRLLRLQVRVEHRVVLPQRFRCAAFMASAQHRHGCRGLLLMLLMLLLLGCSCAPPIY